MSIGTMVIELREFKEEEDGKIIIVAKNGIIVHNLAYSLVLTCMHALCCKIQKLISKCVGRIQIQWQSLYDTGYYSTLRVGMKGEKE